MIEIREVKDSCDCQWLDDKNTHERVFAFYEGELLVTSLHLNQITPEMAQISGIKTQSHGQIDIYVVQEGLIRTACHALHSESVKWLLADNALIQANEVLKKFFLPVSQQRELQIEDYNINVTSNSHDEWVMDTGMIYKTSCKGCGG